MPNYIRPETGEYPITLDEVKKSAGKNISFAADRTDFSEFGYEIVLQTERPARDVTWEIQPVRIDGQWTQQWGARDYTPEEEILRAETRRGKMVVSRFQARAALYQQGILDAVEDIMDSPETDPIAKIAWADAQEFKRTSPTIKTFSSQLGLTDEQLDSLFALAATIDA